MPEPEVTHELRVPAERAGERLDRLLVELLGLASRSRLQGWIREGRVELDGRATRRAGQPVEAGQRITLRMPPERPPVELGEARRQLPLVHSDEHLAVVEKPAGLLTHRPPGGREAAAADLATALLGELPSSGEPERGGIVHRLDRHTSGLLVLARTPAALEGLQALFRERRVEKGYLALVHGAPRFESDWIELPLGRDPRRPERVTTLPEGEGRGARTFYEVIERFPAFALLACRPETGRMHQIRVHLAASGLPIVGDRVYPARRTPDLHLPAGAPDPGRHALHASRLAFPHPVTGEPLAFESPLPPDLEPLLAWLRSR